MKDFNFDAKMWISAKFMKHPSYLFEKKIRDAAKIETIVPLFIL